MRNRGVLWMLIISFNCLGYGQTEKDSIVQLKPVDGLNQAGIYISLPLAKNLSLNSGMNGGYINSLIEVNFPLFLQYNINDKLKLSVGPSLKAEQVSSFLFSRGYTRSSPYGMLEIQYDFNENIYGKIQFNKSLDNMPALNFGHNPNGNIRFSTGFSF